MTAARRAGALLAALLGLCAGASAQGSYPGTAFRVNGVEISYQRFGAFYEEYRRSKGVAIGARGDQLPLLTRLRREAADLMIEQELVRQAARGAGITVPDEEVDAALAELRKPFEEPGSFARRLETEGYTEASYRDHVRGMIGAKRYLDGIRDAHATVSDAELEEYYRANTIRLALPEQVRVRHILITSKATGTADDRPAIRAQMAPILERARAGEDFAALARQYSEDVETAQNGGDTGFFHRGQMVPAFEDLAFSLQPGAISEMVDTPFGVHILRVEERKEARLLPLEEIREQLRDHVRTEKAEEAVKAEIARLREAAKIEVLIPR